MKRGQRRESRARLGLIGALALAAVVLALLPSEAGAVTCPPPIPGADSDGDGLTDGEECTLAPGITLPSGVTLFANNANNIATCGTQPCLDPNKKTLFVILVPASPTKLPSEPLSLLESLGIDVVRINAPADFNRVLPVASGQKAARCAEDAVSLTIQLAQSSWGTPNDADECTVFTFTVEDDINDMFTDCAAATPSSTTVDNYKRWTVNHEYGHLVGTRFEYDSALGGHHYRERDAVVMSQSVAYRCTSKSPFITVKIPSTWATPDLEDVAVAGSLAGP